MVEEEVRERCGRGHPCEMEVGAKVLNRKHVWGRSGGQAFSSGDDKATCICNMKRLGLFWSSGKDIESSPSPIIEARFPMHT